MTSWARSAVAQKRTPARAFLGKAWVSNDCPIDTTRPPSCDVGVSEGEPPCGNLAVNRIRLGKEYLYGCATCTEGFTDDYV